MAAATRRPAAPAPSLTTLRPARCQPIGCRNGHLNQIAYSLYLFIRDVADGDLVGWIDDQLAKRTIKLLQTSSREPNALIEPLRNVYGISDKVLAMALSDILIGAADVRPRLARGRRAADRR